jgi:large subunit ribosomal protein L25
MENLMAREITDLLAEVRTGTGKGAARQARREGYVPGIIYGDGQEPTAIKMKYNYLLTKLRQGRFLQTLFNLKVEGQPDVHVICRSVQRDVVKDLPTHVDFMRIHDESRIELFIHVTFINHEASPGLKRGGTLTVVRPEVELEVTAGDIPDHITVDLTGKMIGDVIHINDVVLPEGAKPTIARNFVIANVAAPAGLAAVEEEAAPAA